MIDCVLPSEFAKEYTKGHIHQGFEPCSWYVPAEGVKVDQPGFSLYRLSTASRESFRHQSRQLLQNRITWFSFSQYVRKLEMPNNISVTVWGHDIIKATCRYFWTGKKSIQPCYPGSSSFQSENNNQYTTKPIWKLLEPFAVQVITCYHLLSITKPICMTHVITGEVLKAVFKISSENCFAS